MTTGAASARRRWHWIDDGLLTYLLAVLRTLWVWPALYVLNGWLFLGDTRGLLTPLAVLALLAGGSAAAQAGAMFFASRGALAGALTGAVAGLVAVVAVLYLSLPGAPSTDPQLRWLGPLTADLGRTFVTLVVAAWLWWWGVTAGRDRLSYDTLVRNFAIGLAGLLAAMLLNAAQPMLPAATLLACLLAYLVLGLFAVALAAIQYVRRFEQAGGSDRPPSLHWWTTVGVVVAVLVLLALALSWLFAPATLGQLGATILALLSFLGQTIAWLVTVVILPILLLLDVLLRLLPTPTFRMQPPELSPPPSLAEQLARLNEPAPVAAAGPQTLYWVTGAIVAAVVVFALFLLAFRRFHVEAEEDVAVTHESVFSLDLLKAQLAQLLRRPGPAAAEPAPFLALSGDDPAVAVRRTYQALLAWAAAQSLPRPPGMTPAHYARLLADRYPAQRQAVETITAAYSTARYGDGRVSPETAAAAAAAWEGLRAAPPGDKP